MIDEFNDKEGEISQLSIAKSTGLLKAIHQRRAAD